MLTSRARSPTIHMCRWCQTCVYTEWAKSEDSSTSLSECGSQYIRSAADPKNHRYYNLDLCVEISICKVEILCVQYLTWWPRFYICDLYAEMLSVVHAPLSVILCSVYSPHGQLRHVPCYRWGSVDVAHSSLSIKVLIFAYKGMFVGIGWPLVIRACTSWC
jgi:hypothetical protein